MSLFIQRVARRIGVEPDRIERIAGGDLTEVLRVRRDDGSVSVAKGSPAPGTEAAMLRALVGAGVPAPTVEAEHDDLLLLEHIDNDGVFSARSWADIGTRIAVMHDHHGEHYGWPVDFALGTIALDNRPAANWPAFWGEQRLASAAALLDRPWRERIDRVKSQLGDLLPDRPAPAFLHGDLWSGNILVRDGKLAALIDPACYFGHREVDLAMICLFSAPETSFWESYGPLEEGWSQRRPIYQLFPALVHLRLFGSSYAPLVERLLAEAGF